MIPDDWEVNFLHDCVTFLDSKRIPIKDSDRAKMAGSYPYYGASGIIDYVNNYIFDDDLILLGEDGANIVDRSSELAFVIHGKCWINNHAHVLKPNSDFDINFLANYLESLKYDQYNTGTAQPKLNREKCNLIPVLKPSLAEQQRIAKTLSDVDAVISTTEKLIQKKKNIKQGTMQQLLTGKKRLPGFATTTKFKQTELGDIPEDWEVMSIRETCFVFTGGEAPLIFSNEKNEMFKYPIYSNGKEVYGYYTSYTISQDAVCISSIGENTGDVFYYTAKFMPIIRLKVIIPKIDRINTKYLYYFLKTRKIDGTKNGGIPNINSNDVKELIFAIPSKQEQTAIANVLSSIDKEIETLNTKLEKYRNLKTAMMQQLLTGKIRLF